jgi:hypothetical protein
VVSVLSIEPRGPGFKPGRGDGFFRAIKIRSTPSLWGVVKSETPCRKILHVKITRKHEQKDFAKPDSFASPVPPACYQMTTGRIARKLCWTNYEFSSVDIIPPWFSVLIYHLGDEQWARWWPQFRDVVSPRRHDNHHHHHDLINHFKPISQQF